MKRKYLMDLSYSLKVSHFCSLRDQKSITRSSPQFNQLEFGLKELYRTLDYLHNYCTLNRTAIDKILKKHDKTSRCTSRNTINDAVSKLQFCEESEVFSIRQFTERLWKDVSVRCALDCSWRKERNRSRWTIWNELVRVSLQNWHFESVYL